MVSIVQVFLCRAPIFDGPDLPWDAMEQFKDDGIAGQISLCHFIFDNMDTYCCEFFGFKMPTCLRYGGL